MKNIILLNKKEGETPLEALEVFRRRNNKYKNAKMTYAGRLDPMARGLLLVLVGEEVKKKETYLALPKEYEFEILFGFATDTYDILGKITHSKVLTNIRMKKFEEKIKKNLEFFKGKIRQKYPLYSSRTWARVRAGEAVDALEREIEVKNLKLFKIKKITSRQLLANIEKRIKKVKGDFRQKEILNIWRKNLGSEQGESLLIARLKIKCSSGTYVRGIADELGKRLGTPALAFRIKRVKIGEWQLPLKLNTKN